MNFYKKVSFIILVVFVFNIFSPLMVGAQNITSEGVGSGDSVGKDFALMAVYGTMSGMIIGAASLAFVSRPLTKLRSIAIGASLGLYVGLLLGGLVLLDRNIGTGGGGIFDVPIEEEVPIVYLKDTNFKISFPTILAMERTYQKENDSDKVKKTTWVGLSLFKMTF